MIPSSPFRKVFQGVADRRQMFRLFDRHAQRPNRWSDVTGALHAGEWFEIGEVEHDHMLDILPPLWMRGSMFALAEFLTGSITSVFFTLRIGNRARWFHGYCDLSDRTSPDRMRAAILERESRPDQTMTREECLEHIWSETHDDFRGYAGDDRPEHARGQRTVKVFCGRPQATERLLDALDDTEITAKLPGRRWEPVRAAAVAA